MAITLLVASPDCIFANDILLNTTVDKYDSILPERHFTSSHASTLLELLDAENNFNQSGNSKKAMLKLLRIAGMKKSLHYNSFRAHLLIDLANISIRLKMYPAAMKCYDQAIRINRRKILSPDEDSQYATDTINYSRFLQIDTMALMHISTLSQLESPPVRIQDIRSSFQDRKPAVFWAIIVHVKQPIPGKRKAFSRINNVGHTFITLIKFNEDNSFVSRSFGFYPAKKSFLSATPIHPGDSPVFKDDALHPWDETVSKFITERKFDRILDNLEKFSRTHYNLNKNNCTDFGLSEAIIAGINIRETAGRWPLGRGNNPANAGQSLLDKKFENDDPDYPETLVVNEKQDLLYEPN